MKISKEECIYFITLIYLAVCSPFLFIWINQESFKKPNNSVLDEGRNERSTPRTFVLPANTAVAYEQEKKFKNNMMREINIKCGLALHDKGYEISNIEAIYSHRVFSQTLRYQYKNNLQPTGSFNMETRKSLEC